MCLNGFWKLAELLDIEMHGIFKGTVFHLKLVAGINHYNRSSQVVGATIEPLHQFCRRNKAGSARFRLNGGMIHANDFIFDFD